MSKPKLYRSNLFEYARKIEFDPKIFKNPINKGQYEIYITQFVKFLREKKNVEIITSWIWGDKISEEGYMSDAWGIKDRYEPRKPTLISLQKDNYAPNYFDSQEMCIKKVVTYLLEENNNDKE